MAEQEELEKLRSKLRENSLGISRLPKETKLKFMEIAIAFSDDYGMTLKWILEQAIEYQEAKKMFVKIYELDKRMEYLESLIVPEQKEETKPIKTLGGKIIK